MGNGAELVGANGHGSLVCGIIIAMHCVDHRGTWWSTVSKVSLISILMHHHVFVHRDRIIIDHDDRTEGFNDINTWWWEHSYAILRTTSWRNLRLTSNPFTMAKKAAKKAAKKGGKKAAPKKAAKKAAKKKK
jgi:hypothetical protein